MKLNYSIIFYLEFLKISCRTDIVDQDQTAQTVQSDVGSTLSVNLGDVFLSKMQLLNGNIQVLTLKALFDLFFQEG